MTTEQMDWLDDERAGRHNYVGVTPESLVKDDGRGRWPFTPNPDDKVREVTDAITDTTQFSEDTLFKVQQAIRVYADPETTTDIISEMQNAGILFRERITDAEEHTHHTREARDQCAAGDHQYAKLLDDVAEREKIKATIDTPQGVTTMAEEPIENRLRRAWLNGFKDGVDRASYAATESTGRWDY